MPDSVPTRGGNWRPAQFIKVKALGLHWRDGRLLAAGVYDDAGKLKGVRPPGGTVEFGEDWKSALAREFREELDVEICIHGDPLIMENIYVHEGETGHEVLFIADVAFDHSAFGLDQEIRFMESNGAECIARWFDLEDLKARGISLFPPGLEEKPGRKITRPVADNK